MPITKSAKKALKVSKRRHAINLRVKRAYKEAVRNVRRITEDTEESKKAQGKSALTKAYSELDKAAKKGVIHKNKASRLKSRLAKLTQSL